MNNTLLIIGASSDLGRETIKMADKNTTIVAHCNSGCDRIEELNDSRIHTFKANLQNEQEIMDMMDAIESQMGLPNQIVHLAAPKMKNIRFKQMQWQDFQSDFDIQLKSLFLILNRFIPALVKAKTPASVISVLSSVTLGMPPTALCHYTTAKYAVLGFMKSLLSEYATKSIRLNCISPSMTDTRFLSELNEKIIEINAEANPMKRNATPAEVAGAICYLLSEQSAYINGVNLPITGGSIY